MDGLKRSLEEAIKEMQDIPAATQPSMRQDPDLRLARAADTLQTMQPMPERAVTPERPETRVPAKVSQTAPDFIPATNSIEAALSSAPAVSPHYVPPQPAVVAVASTTPAPAGTAARPARQKTETKRKALRFGTPQNTRPAPKQPALNTSSTFPAPQLNGQQRTGHIGQTGPVGADLVDGGNLAADLMRKVKKQRDNVWRWATIGISCAGGLASGWLGSNLTSQTDGIFQASVQTIVGKASQNISGLRPENIKIVPEGGAEFMSGTAIGGLPVNMTGKTDRAVPHDDNLCTVLELDRGTGLTLARPCKMMKSAEVNETLGKADLLVKPR